ncbi:Vacuolar morphogenesis protein 7 [Candida viswanathii]|uniref:Vacuolar morphogenesis protein 7 n=1 Tax=Candida viswanathii TaxID=5486 RepID=A0A367XUZ5_9ASCO|nr:Vacuolar morphogenesis protein 7 [Candida viswanathii]
MAVITIPSDTEISGSVYYEIHVKLPLRSFVVKKRYLEFELLVLTLCHHLGISSRDFPYSLPGKRIHWLNKTNVVEERKVALAEFLNNIVQDTSLQNEKDVLSFLQLPLSFKFTKEMLSNGRADLESVEKNWYDVYRNLKLDIVNESASNVNEKIQLRDRISRLYQPRMIELLQTLGNTDRNEVQKRKQLIGQLQEKVDELLSDDHPQLSKSKRVLGGGAAVETAETLPLDNKELLQHQLQIHKDQDKELEQLRAMIARQRQIGELINSEVEEQNAMLDRFNDEVDYTAGRVKQARNRARKIL